MYETFREKEREGWGARAGIYADSTARITTQAIPALLHAVRVRVGLRRGAGGIGRAGVKEVEVIEVASVYHPPSGDFFDDVMRFSVRTPLICDRQSPLVQQATRAEVTAGLAPCQTDAGIVVPVPSFVMAGVAA